MAMATAESAVTWRLEDGRAVLSSGMLQGEVGFDQLGVRFVPLRWNGREQLDICVLGASGPHFRDKPLLEIPEAYVRGCDLVVTYAKVPPHQISPQFYWRASWHAEFQAAGIELIFSMQTELLDSRPQTSITSYGDTVHMFHADQLDAARFETLTRPSVAPGHLFDRSQSAEHLLVWRDEQHGFSYAEMVHPTDFVSARIWPDAKPWNLESELFPDSLEKGVIRRARIAGWFMPAENDLQVAVELARQFVAEPPPLTT
jgi:hypothetical protein